MTDLAIRNWSKYQHYGNRPGLPWVKFHVELLDDDAFSALPEASRLVGCLLLLVARRRGNRFPDSPEWLAAELKIPTAKAKRALADLLALRFLVPASEVASDPASASASTVASAAASGTASRRGRPRTRGEAEAEREEERTAEQSVSVVRPAALPNEDSLEELGQRLEGVNGRAAYGSVDSVFEVIDKPAANTRRELEKWLAELPPQLVERVREQVLACEPRKSKAAYAVGTAQRLARERGAA